MKIEMVLGYNGKLAFMVTATVAGRRLLSFGEDRSEAVTDMLELMVRAARHKM